MGNGIPFLCKAREMSFAIGLWGEEGGQEPFARAFSGTFVSGKIMHSKSGTVFPKSIHQFLGMSFSLPADMGTQFEDHI